MSVFVVDQKCLNKAKVCSERENAVEGRVQWKGGCSENKGQWIEGGQWKVSSSWHCGGHWLFWSCGACLWCAVGQPLQWCLLASRSTDHKEPHIIVGLRDSCWVKALLMFLFYAQNIIFSSLGIGIGYCTETIQKSDADDSSTSQ